jgi:transposase InsO family protein
MGGRKLLHELQAPMAQLGIHRGRDAFFELLSAHDLLVPVRRNRQRTTRSGWWRYPNLLAGLEVVRTHQVWVADITYLTTEQGFVYLALITDAFSRFIVGYDLSVSLAVEGCQRALENAVRQAANNALQGLIHHSDHGIQYTAHAYRDRLQALGIQPSMGDVGNCYDNPLAERVNGILKGEYGLADLFVDFDHSDAAVRQAVWLYNYERPHLALNYQKPANVHLK